MEKCYSPIISKIAGQVISKPKRSFNRPTEVCLEDWWLSKPSNGDGFAVAGIPMEFRKCDEVQKSLDFASPKRRYALREFHSTKIVKRHGSTLLETSNGFLVSLCGFINKSRTQENGFSSEICRDFINGFPFNWEDYTAQSTDVEMESNESFFGSFTTADLDSFNAAHLHDLVLSLTDRERDVFIERMNYISTLNPQQHEVQAHTPKPSATSPLHTDVVTPEDSFTNASNNQKSTHVCVDLRDVADPTSYYGVTYISKKRRRTSLGVSLEKN